MSPDEQAIRSLVDTWMSASKSGDVATVLDLMTDDVIFMVPGQAPFGKKAFAQASAGMKDVKIEGTGEIEELEIAGDWAWMRNRIRIVLTLPDGRTLPRSGYTLTVLRKGADGRWRIARDANLVMPEADTNTADSV